MTEYSASTENLLEEGSMVSAESSQNLYMSLLPTISSSKTSLTTYRAPTATGYLHPQPSINNSSTTLSKKHRHKGKRTHRKDSTSSDSRQTEAIKHSFKKLQICFVVLCLLNIIMIIVFITTYPRFGSLFSGDSGDDFTETGNGQLKIFKLCTKCQPLEAKVGFASGLIENIRSSKYPKFCCFRRVDQLLSLFDGYAERYVDQEVFKVRQEMNHNISRQTGVVTSNHPLALAHLYYTHEDGPSGTVPITWETSGIDILMVGSMKIEEQRHLQIPYSGYYYIYSRLQLIPGSVTSHVIMKNFEEVGQKKKRALLKQKQNSGNKALVSELQGVVQLKMGDSLTVLATMKAINGDDRGSYFGAFMLQER